MTSLLTVTVTSREEDHNRLVLIRDRRRLQLTPFQLPAAPRPAGETRTRVRPGLGAPSEWHAFPGTTGVTTRPA